MTNVTVLVSSKQNYTGIKMSGHAGLTDGHQDGQELACVVISALTLNMVNSVEQFTDDTFETDMDEETGPFKFQFAQGFSSEPKFPMNSLVSDLENVVGMYGKPYIKIRFEGVQVMSKMNLQLFAHERGVGSTKNGRNSEFKRLGAERADGQFVLAGNILYRQRDTRIHPGTNAGRDGDGILFTMVDGVVGFERKGRDRKQASVYPRAINEQLKHQKASYP